MTRGAPDLGRRVCRAELRLGPDRRAHSEPGAGPSGSRGTSRCSTGQSARAQRTRRRQRARGPQRGWPPRGRGRGSGDKRAVASDSGRCPAALGTRLGHSLQMGSTRDPGHAPRWGVLRTEGRPGHKPALARGAACSRRPRTSPRAGGRRTVSGGQRPRYVLSTEGGDRRLWGDAPLSSKRNTRRP